MLEPYTYRFRVWGFGDGVDPGVLVGVGVDLYHSTIGSRVIENKKNKKGFGFLEMARTREFLSVLASKTDPHPTQCHVFPSFETFTCHQASRVSVFTVEDLERF